MSHEVYLNHTPSSLYNVYHIYGQENKDQYELFFISRMAIKTAVDNLFLDAQANKLSSHKYEVRDVELIYVEINNNNGKFSKMEAMMAAENFNLMYLCQ